MTSVNSWIWAPPWAATGPTRLLCIPYAGGGPSAFFPFSKALPPEVSLWVASLPGREGRLHEPRLTNIQAMTEPLWTAVAADQAEQEAEGLSPGKLILFGHSMGALIAFELARLLHERGPVAPDLLIVSGRVAPGVPRTQEWIHNLPDDEFLLRLEQRYQGLPRHIRENPELLELYLPTLRTDMQALEQYQFQPGPPLSCPITARYGLDDPATNPEQMAQWQNYTQGNFRIEATSGGHFFPFQDLESTLASLRMDLAQIKAAPKSQRP